MAKVHAAYESLKGGADSTGVAITPSTKKDVYMVGVTVPVGAGAFLADYTKLANKTTGVTASDAQQYAIGYTYSLSKRTNVYTSYSQTKNEANVAINTTTAGATDKLFNVGIRHAF